MAVGDATSLQVLRDAKHPFAGLRRPRSRPRRARETVATDTPATRTTSVMVLMGPFLSDGLGPWRASALHAAGEQAAHEVPLQGEEHDRGR